MSQNSGVIMYFSKAARASCLLAIALFFMVAESAACTNPAKVASSVTELRAALSSAGGDGCADEVEIMPGHYYVKEPIIYDSRGSDETIRITGAGKDFVTFDGENRSVVFEFRKNGDIGSEEDWQNDSSIANPPFPNLEISGLTIQNGACFSNNCNKFGDRGAAINVEAFDMRVTSTNFFNNQSSYEGAAIAGANDTFISDSSFERNGGSAAISICGSLTIERSSFSKNTGMAVYRGICVFGNQAEDPVEVRNSSFSENGRQSVYLLGDWETLPGQAPVYSFENVDFLNNAHTPITARDGLLFVRNSRFIGNKGGFQRGIYGSYNGNPNNCIDYRFDCWVAGAIAILNFSNGISQAVVENSVFRNNSAPNYGGAISMLGVRNCEVPIVDGEVPCEPNNADNVRDPSLIIRDTVFQANSSHWGAAITAAREPLARNGLQTGNVLLDGVQFIGNVGVSKLPGSGEIPIDGVKTSIVDVGGRLLSRNVTYTENNADFLLKSRMGLEDVDVPEKPQVAELLTDSESLRISLSEESSNSLAVTYRVTCNGLTESSVSNDLVFDDLEPGTEYLCEASVLNILGESEALGPFTVETLMPTGLPVWLLHEASKR